jgi:hypothetical protein
MAEMAPTKFVPLRSAPWTFASKRLRSARYAVQEASQKSQKSQLAELEERKKRASENPAEVSKVMLDTFNDIIEGLNNWSAPELAMEASLLEKLQEGKLQAFGVQSAPKQSREFETIPSHFFLDAKINWNGNKLTNFGVTYTAVRIRRPIASEATPESIKEGPLPSGVRGRPSKTPEVERAIDYLVEKGVALAKIPRPDAYKAVRKAANELKYNTEIGFSDPVVQRVLSRRFGPRR